MQILDFLDTVIFSYIILGVALYGYPLVDGYIPVFLEQLQGSEAILWQSHRES
ncbi:hypothetical protein DSM106972_091860 [Dulcicalothrix desertica PCC 7102]|uniref:Uncharacterized protein n=1 Tax=Dulcicalothrix desertica PCC 7102 TaxID=232991 RepID=A0A3S1BU49_9CYAN|nr:hypothetical protein DSM106972_091860 [Dulcicalothrix desertica PCC 7102]